MSIISIIIGIFLLLIFLVLVQRLVDDQQMKNILNFIAILVFVLWLLGGFGLLNYLKTAHV